MAEQLAPQLGSFIKDYILRTQDYMIIDRVSAFQHIPIQLLDVSSIYYNLSDLLTNPAVVSYNNLYNYQPIDLDDHGSIYGNLISLTSNGKSIYQISGDNIGTWVGSSGQVQIGSYVYTVPKLSEWDSYNSATTRLISSTSQSINLGSLDWLVYKQEENTTNSIVFISANIVTNIDIPLDKNTEPNLLCQEFLPTTENNLLKISEDLLPNYEGIAVTQDGKIKIRVNGDKLEDTENPGLLVESFENYCIDNYVFFVYKLREAETKNLRMFFNDVAINDLITITSESPDQHINIYIYSNKSISDSIMAWNTEIPLKDKIETLTMVGKYSPFSYNGSIPVLRDMEVYTWYNFKLMYGVDYAFSGDKFFLILHNNREYEYNTLILKNIYIDINIPEERLGSIMPFPYTRLLSRSQYKEILQLFIENFFHGAQIESLNKTFENYDPLKPIRIYDYYSAESNKEKQKWLHDGETTWKPSVDRYSIFDAVVELPEEYLSDAMMDGVTRLSFIKDFFKMIKPAHTNIFTDIMMKIFDNIGVLDNVITNYSKDYETFIYEMDEVIVTPLLQIPTPGTEGENPNSDIIVCHEETFPIYDYHLSVIDHNFKIDKTAMVKRTISTTLFELRDPYYVPLFKPGSFIGILTTNDKVIIGKVKNINDNFLEIDAPIPLGEEAIYITLFQNQDGGMYECCFLRLVQN